LSNIRCYAQHRYTDTQAYSSFVVPSPYYPTQNHARTYRIGDMELITPTHSKPCISKTENTGLISIPEAPSKVNYA
jgi:hypothetical protein